MRNITIASEPVNTMTAIISLHQDFIKNINAAISNFTATISITNTVSSAKIRLSRRFA
jgi:hypothetical protein